MTKVVQTLVCVVLLLGVLSFTPPASHPVKAQSGHSISWGQYVDISVTGSRGALGVFASEPSSLLSGGSKLAVEDDSDPWFVLDRLYRTSRQTEGLSWHYRSVSVDQAVMTRDTLWLLGLSGGNKGPLVIGFNEQSLRYEAMDMDFPITDIRRNFGARLRLSYISPIRLDRMTVVGEGRFTSEDEPIIYADYVAGEARRGVGWTIGGTLTYVLPSFHLTLDAFDLIGAMTWRHVFIRKGTLNSQSEIIGQDGYPSLAPVSRGTTSVEKWTVHPTPFWTATVRSTRTSPLSKIVVDGYGYHRTRIVTHWELGNDFGLTIGGHWPSGALDVGFRLKAWDFGVALNFFERLKISLSGVRLSFQW